MQIVLPACRSCAQGSGDTWVTLATEVGRAGAVKTDLQGHRDAVTYALPRALLRKP